MPPEDRVSRAEQVLLERSTRHQGLKARDYLAAFAADTNRIHDLLSGLMPEMRPLDDGETLTYLHGTISTRRHPVAVPETMSWTKSPMATLLTELREEGQFLLRVLRRRRPPLG